MKQKRNSFDLTKEQVKDIVNDVLINVLKVDKSKILENAYLSNDLRIDKFETQVMFVSIEDSLEIVLPTVAIYTVGDLYDLVWKTYQV